MMTSFQDIVRAVEPGRKRRIAVVAAQDEHTLDAVVMAARRGMVSPVLVGDVAAIREILAGLDCPLELVELHPAATSEQAAQAAADLARAGEVDAVMKGKIETGALMKVLVNRETGIRRRDTMSLLAFIDSPHYHKVFGITDVGLLTYPTLEQKRAAIQNAVEAFGALGVQNPKVAVLAAVEKVNPKMPESVEAHALKGMNASGEITGCVVEGPISYDLAMDPEAAGIKGYQSPVAGDADLVVVPDITAGNILIKSLSCTGGAGTAGIILGALVPLVITSRSSPVEDKYMAIVLSALIGGAAQNPQ